MSIKDTFIVKDTHSTVGCVDKIDNIYKEDGLVIKILKSSGAIPFMKTNIP